MKKNKAMRLAAILMVVCLVATCAICGTLAKYTTSGSGSATGNIAKWGISIGNISLTDLFASNGKAETVVAQGKIAPGTANTASFTISGEGTPEVGYSFQVLPTLTSATEGLALPEAITKNVTWTLKQGSTEVATGDWDTFKNDLEEENGNYNAGDDFPIAPGQYTLTWAWPFSTSAEADALDTAAGNGTPNAQGTATTSMNFTFALTMSATQRTE